VTTRADIDSALDRLEASLPKMLEEFGSANVIKTFAAVAEDIRQGTSPADHDYVWARIQSMLRDARLIPYIP
jgi:hypothetical protein